MTLEHWQSVYQARSQDEVSWFEEAPAISLEMIDAGLAAIRARAQPGPTAVPVDARAAVDIGAGRSRLAQELLACGWRPVIALDISASALDQLREQTRADGLSDSLTGGLICIQADVRTWQPEQQVDLWHDRAVFHFLTEPADQAAYADLAARTVLPGGLLIIATFAPDGPEQCSGLPTARHDADGLQRIFASGFEVIDHRREVHRTPWGTSQPFTWVSFRRR